MKLAFFREKRLFPWNPWFFVNFNAFTFIMKVFRVLSTAFVRILLFATCYTSALSSSWHVFTVLLAYIRSWVFVVQKFRMYSSSTDFLVCINIAPRNTQPVNFPWISQTPSVNFPWNLVHFKNSTVKSRIFSRELGWSLVNRSVFIALLHSCDWFWLTSFQQLMFAWISLK